MNAADKKANTVRLMRDAAGEIRRRRTQLHELASYQAHTERMLALFEGGPPPERNQGQSIDVAWELTQAADEIDPE